jgi:hypothetical protein
VQFDHPPLQWHIPIPHPNPPLHCHIPIPHPNSSFPLTNANSSKKAKSHKKGQVLGLEAKKCFVLLQQVKSTFIIFSTLQNPYKLYN